MGVVGMLFSCRLSSWDEEMSSLCCLEEPAKQQIHMLTVDQVLPRMFSLFQDLPRIWLEKVKGMENLYGFILTKK